MRLLERFHEVWVCDFEFVSKPGERPIPVCMVALEIRSGAKLRLWRDQFGRRPPFGIGPDTLFVAYYASAELGCFLSLRWPTPVRILDLFVEFRNLTNGWPTVAGNSLLGALAHFGLDGIGTGEKQQMRECVLRGGSWSKEERRDILDYCQSDVDALGQLLPAMLPQIDLARALYRGRYMAAVAAMEFNGVPVNLERLNRLRENWTQIKDHLIARIDTNYQVFEGRTFKLERFQRFLVRNNLLWPVLDSGRLDLSDETFRQMSKISPSVAPLRELRHALSEMRLNDLAIGSDGRNRCLLSPFGARSGRNTPSNTKYIFGPSVWLRNLIEPPAGYGLAYVDWVQQEFGIAAALSGDPAMLAAYQSGDCYLEFAKQAGAVPADATKESHPIQRELFKQCVLGTQYGMEPQSLALRIDQAVIVARHLQQCHKEIYRKFWQWSDNAVDHAVLYGRQWTTLAGLIEFRRGPIRALCAIFTCKPTAPKC
jgi:DNA polymerase-1